MMNKDHHSGNDKRESPILELFCPRSSLNFSTNFLALKCIRPVHRDTLNPPHTHHTDCSSVLGTDPARHQLEAQVRSNAGLSGLADSEHPRGTDRAGTPSGRTAVLHRDGLGIAHLPSGPTLHAVGFRDTSKYLRWNGAVSSTAASYGRPQWTPPGRLPSFSVRSRTQWRPSLSSGVLSPGPAG